MPLGGLGLETPAKKDDSGHEAPRPRKVCSVLRTGTARHEIRDIRRCVEAVGVGRVERPRVETSPRDIGLNFLVSGMVKRRWEFTIAQPS
jgi:hypothetical protein